MKKVFISQPMHGKTNVQVRAARQRAQDIVQERLGEQVYVMDSFIERTLMSARSLWLLSKSLGELAYADLAFFAKGWEEARGCRIEHQCAEEYGIEIMYE